MSYSRWGSSVWYTYWCAHGGASADDKRDEQLFDICTVKMFTYKELKDDIDGCIDKVREIVDTANATNEGSTQITADEYKELQGYMESFMADIEKEFNTPSQLYKDGEISLDEAFIEGI
jgi:hypothetical protein